MARIDRADPDLVGLDLMEAQYVEALKALVKAREELREAERAAGEIRWRLLEATQRIEACKVVYHQAVESLLELGRKLL